MHTSKKPSNKTKLRLVNNTLSVVVVLLSLYIVVLPLVPNVTYQVNKITNSKQELVRVNLSNSSGQTPNNQTVKTPSENTLVIPSINLQKTVFDGNYIGTLEKGVWRRPATSNPEAGGNTVLVGHRYGYKGNGVFYHLDKVRVGDSIVLYWNGRKYVYEVDKIRVVPPTDQTVESPSNQPILTLYTCTPMWTFTDRLVLTARQVE